MSDSGNQEPKKTIRHTLSLRSPHPTRGLTEAVLLAAFDSSPQSSIQKANRLQKQLRWQYYRWIGRDPDLAQKLTYRLNCRPFGFRVSPWSIVCRDTRVCPWCFVRRLYDGYQVLDFTERPQIRNLHTIIAWRRHTNFGEPLPFFNRRYGPHQWCKALVTVQYAVPMMNERGELQMRHVGFQIVPKSIDPKEALTRKAVNPPVAVLRYDDITNGNLVLSMAKTMQLPWHFLFDEDNLHQFIQLSGSYPKARLLRIQGQNNKGENCGN